MVELIVFMGYARPKSKLNIFSRIIRAFENYMSGLDASHAYVEIGENIIESTFPKGRRINKTKWLKHYHIVESYAFKLKCDENSLIQWLDKNIVDKPYSLTQNIVIGATGILLQVVNPKNWSFVEKLEFNGRCSQNCTEAQIMFASKFLKFSPTEGLDQYSVGEARDFIKSVWEVRGIK
jgi:hypothetical protein